MKEGQTLKDFLDEAIKSGMVKVMTSGLLSKMIELESIENWLNVMYGIELDITVRAAEKKEGRHYGKSVIENL